MSGPSSSDKVILITGASGFVASHLINLFLTSGYHVRGTLRSESAIPKILAAQGALSSNLTFAIIRDMSAPNAFNDAVKGVSGIIHTASPFVLSPKDNESELLQPAIQGTLNVLRAAATHAGPQLTRVVTTSSFAAIVDLTKGYRPGYTYTEKDFNPVTYEEAAASPDGAFTYCASKALAERAAWDWMAEHKPHFSFATVNPPWVFGPSFNQITSLEHLNESTETIWNLVNGSSKDIPPTDFGGFAHVKDVAKAHLLVYEKREAAGERFLVGSHFDYQSASDAIRENFPELLGKVPEGVKGAGLTAEVYAIDATKVKTVLDLELTSLEDTMVETVADLLEAEKRLSK